MMYDANQIEMIGFEKIEGEMTIVFSKSGVAILPTCNKQTINNYPIMVKRENDRIIITDKDLIDLFKYRALPYELDFVDTKTGYAALKE